MLQRTTKELESYREVFSPVDLEARSLGWMCGSFLIPKAVVQSRCGRHDRADIFVFAYDGSLPDGPGHDWEHVSVSLVGKSRCPDWSEMSLVKGLFWGEEETVVQFHPPKSEHVNNHEYCLHLWRWRGGEFPRPSALCVGIPESVNALLATDDAGRVVDAAVVSVAGVPNDA